MNKTKIYTHAVLSGALFGGIATSMPSYYLRHVAQEQYGSIFLHMANGIGDISLVVFSIFLGTLCDNKRRFLYLGVSYIMMALMVIVLYGFNTNAVILFATMVAFWLLRYYDVVVRKTAFNIFYVGNSGFAWLQGARQVSTIINSGVSYVLFSMGMDAILIGSLFFIFVTISINFWLNHNAPLVDLGREEFSYKDVAKYLFSQKIVLYALTLTGFSYIVLNVLGSMHYERLINLSNSPLEALTRYVPFVGLFIGFGAISGCLFVWIHKHFYLATVSHLLIGSLILFSVFFVGLGDAWLYLFLIGLYSYTTTVVRTARDVYMIKNLPKKMSGRVMMFYEVVSQGFSAIFTIIFGFVVVGVGGSYSFVILSAMLLLIAVCVILLKGRDVRYK